MGRKNHNKHNPYEAKRIDKIEGYLLRALQAEWARNHPTQYPKSDCNSSVPEKKTANQNKWNN